MAMQNCLLLSQVAYCYLISLLEQKFFPLALMLASFFHSLKFSLHLFLSIFVNFHGLSIPFSVSNISGLQSDSCFPLKMSRLETFSFPLQCGRCSLVCLVEGTLGSAFECLAGFPASFSFVFFFLESPQPPPFISVKPPPSVFILTENLFPMRNKLMRHCVCEDVFIQGSHL